MNEEEKLKVKEYTKEYTDKLIKKKMVDEDKKLRNIAILNAEKKVYGSKIYLRNLKANLKNIKTKWNKLTNYLQNTHLAEMVYEEEKNGKNKKESKCF